MKSIPLVPLLFLLLSGCASVVPGTAILASRLDPLTVDPADVAAFPVLPDGLGLMPGGSLLTLSGVNEADGRARTEVFVLQPWDSGYRIDPSDHVRFRALQQELTAWADGPGVDGSLSIDAGPCRLGPGPAEDARYSVDVILRAGGPRLPLLKSAPLSAVGLNPDTLPSCPEH